MRLRTAVTTAAAGLLVCVSLASGATTGGGSSIQAVPPAKAGGFVVGGGTITRVGSRYAASYAIALYRMSPGAQRGTYVSGSKGQIGSAAAVTVNAFARCNPTRQTYRWFLILRVNSKKTSVSKYVALDKTTTTVSLRCR